jgi:hypothetical protein
MARLPPATAFASLLLLLPLAPACSQDAQFTTRFAADFVHPSHTVSVLGVFRDGRMSSDAWETVGPKLSTPFGKTCDTAYGALIGTNPTLSAAIDDYVRANGPGDELLEQLAPAATGDLIVVYTVAGHVAPKAASTGPDTSGVSGGAPGGAMSGGSKYRGSRQSTTPGRGMATPTNTNAAFEVSASFYSVSGRRSVGVVAMGYDGPSLDEALQRMAAKLGMTLPQSTCGGWNLEAHLDEAKIRELIEH